MDTTFLSDVEVDGLPPGVEDHGLRVGGQWSGHDYHIDPSVADRMCIGREGCNTV